MEVPLFRIRKNFMSQIIIAGILGLLVGFGAGQWGDDGMEKGANMREQNVSARSDMSIPLSEDYVSVRPQVENLATQALSDEEVSGLLFMREEEKLARDVYSVLHDQWELPIFSNIARSEQTHTEAVRGLIEKYDLDDPVTDDTIGVFVNPELQVLYQDLVAEGSKSLVDALKVGALIEDLDIKDLEEQMALTDNDDIMLVYGNLQRGSRNHLRSFVSTLEKNGASYEPQYISEDEYEEIIGSDRETGGNESRLG